MTKYLRVSDIIERLKGPMDESIKPHVWRKGVVGTTAHCLIECYCNGTLVNVEEQSADFLMRAIEENVRDGNGTMEFYMQHFEVDKERGIVYFDSYKMWHAQHKPKYLITERRFYDESLVLTGKIDATLYRDGKIPILVDFKTSTDESFLRDGESAWKMQGHYYWWLLKTNNEQVDRDFIFLKLRQKKCKDKDTGQIWYEPLEPEAHLYEISEQLLLRCLEEVEKTWEVIGGKPHLVQA